MGLIILPSNIRPDDLDLAASQGPTGTAGTGTKPGLNTRPILTDRDPLENILAENTLPSSFPSQKDPPKKVEDRPETRTETSHAAGLKNERKLIVVPDGQLDLNATGAEIIQAGTSRPSRTLITTAAGIAILAPNMLAQSVIDPAYKGLSQGDLSSLDQLQFWLGAVAVGGCIAAGIMIANSSRRNNANTIVQLRGWMERQGAVLTNSIGMHTDASVRSFWKSEKHRVDTLLKEDFHPRAEKTKLTVELGQIEEKLQILKSLTPGTWWMPFDLPAPITFRPFQVYMTPWGYGRRQVEQMKNGTLGETLNFADKTSMPLDGSAYKEAIRACLEGGWILEYLTEMQGTYSPRIQNLARHVGSPKEWINTIYEAGVAAIASMRGPDGAPGQQFQNQEARFEGMLKRAETFVSYFKEEIFNQGPFDMPWARVYAASGHALAFFEQIENQKSQNPNLRTWDMRFSTSQSIERSRYFAKELRNLAKTKDGATEVAALAAQLSWMLGAFDSLIWYRGTDNWKQMAQPVMQEQISVVRADEPHFQRWLRMAPLAYAERPEQRYAFERSMFQPGGPGIATVYGRESIVQAMTEYTDVNDVQAAQRAMLPGEKGDIRGLLFPPRTQYW